MLELVAVVEEEVVEGRGVEEFRTMGAGWRTGEVTFP